MKIRSCDKFGASVHLLHEGETERGTLGGGVASVCLSSLILAYFCMRAIDIASFKDPSIVNFSKQEDRSKMNSPINLGDYG